MLRRRANDIDSFVQALSLERLRDEERKTDETAERKTDETEPEDDKVDPSEGKAERGHRATSQADYNFLLSRAPQAEELPPREVTVNERVVELKRYRVRGIDYVEYPTPNTHAHLFRDLRRDQIRQDYRRYPPRPKRLSEISDFVRLSDQ